MATITIDEENLNIVLGTWDKIWAFHGSLRIPLAHVSGVRIADQAAWQRAWTKLVGTSLPGIKTAGTFFSGDGLIFCDYGDGKSTVEIDVTHEFYKQIVIQLDEGKDPAQAVAEIESGLKR
ncbi:MAG: hypothetical protein NVS9B12_11940 [Vulcanimicrobiaceae bacterium]